MVRKEMSALLRSPLFQTIGAGLCGILEESGSLQDFRRGEMVFWQGESAESLLAVLSGCIKLCRETGGHEHEVIGVLTAGQVYFEPSMFGYGRHHVIAEAVSSVRVVRLDAEILRAAILRRPELAFELMALSSAANKGLVEQVEQLKTRSVPQRIGAFLLHQAELAQTPTRYPPAFALPFSKTLIARFVGAKLESFSRSLVPLAEQGVEISSDRVTIADVERLAAFVHGPAGDKPHDRRPILTRFASMGKRQKFNDGLVRSWRKAQSAGAPISLLLIEVGQTQSGQARFGQDHAAKAPLGEADRGLLASVGDNIAREADRHGRFMVHYGDDIFALAAPQTDDGDAMRLAERLAILLEHEASRHADAPVVAAIGAATIFPTAQDHIEKIVCFADIALYRAKTLGRGKICRFHDDPSCAKARQSPSGGARIPVIESPYCATCRKDAPCG
ncbi:diguanylate cyclase (GGDEF)-like protein [Rhodoblastus sphagnicola]|nr:cyclic nucleotide-binding domain-containing protein [Rhodoblastus sphagnicola]MBB4196845.1 diguanylate cyclase (GGDEF)-like protein [Rhodoblastus sphagnicola]